MSFGTLLNGGVDVKHVDVCGHYQQEGVDMRCEVICWYGHSQESMDMKPRGAYRDEQHKRERVCASMRGSALVSKCRLGSTSIL